MEVFRFISIDTACMLFFCLGVSMRSLIFIFFALSALHFESAFALDANGNFESVQERDSYIEKALLDMAVSINKQAPIPSGGDTQITSALAIGKTINIYVKLLTYKSADIAEMEFNSVVRKDLNEIVCKAKPMRAMIDLGVVYSYFYSGSDDRLISKVDIDNYDCK